MVKTLNQRLQKLEPRILAPRQPITLTSAGASSLVTHDHPSDGQTSGIGLDLVPRHSPVSSYLAYSDICTSPASNQSTGPGSFADSCAWPSTTCSGSISLLGRKRKLTPVLETPTSSVVSGHDPVGSRLLAVGGSRRLRRRGSLSQRSDDADTQRQLPLLASKLAISLSNSAMDETLMHVGHHSDQSSSTHVKSGGTMDLAFNPLRPEPQSPQPSNKMSPWNEHSLLYGEHTHSSPTSSETRRGGRPVGRILTVEEAEHAAKMRKDRACLKCHINRDRCEEAIPGTPCRNCTINQEKCEGGNPDTPCWNCEINNDKCETSCRKCNVKQRNWVLGCTKTRLEDGIEYFIPAVYTNDLDRARFDRFMNRNSMTWQDKEFRLSLTQNIGGSKENLLRIWVREVDPLEDNLLKRYLHLASDGSVKSVKLDGPPLYPFSQEVEPDIEVWLRDIEVSVRGKWHWYCFLEMQDPLWEREIMAEICTYCHEDDLENSPLKNALSLTVLLYLTIHPFEVPEGDVKALYQRLQHPLFRSKIPDSEVSPRAVNKYIAILLLPKLRDAAHQALRDLVKLLRTRTQSVSMKTRELVFCVAFCCLMAVARLQTLVIQYHLGDAALGEESISREKAVEQIMKMEDDLGRLIIELSVVLLRKTSKAHPVKSGSLFDRLNKVAEHCCEEFNDPKKYRLEVFDESMVEKNVGRLLRKFFMAVKQWME